MIPSTPEDREETAQLKCLSIVWGWVTHSTIGEQQRGRVKIEIQIDSRDDHLAQIPREDKSYKCVCVHWENHHLMMNKDRK